MSSLMDIIAASFFGGIISLIIINANFVIRETWASYNSNLIVQQILVNNAQIIEGELRNMGCGLPNPQDAIVEARDTCIQFQTTLSPDLNTFPVTIKYYIGSPAEHASSENPALRFLYREVNGGVSEKIGMASQFRFAYFTKLNDPLTTPVTGNNLSNIAVIEINMQVQSPFAPFMSQDSVGGAYNQKYASALWKQTRLASPNYYR